MIRYNYYLTTFKEVFNDVIEERKHIIKEEFASGGSQMVPSDQIGPLPTFQIRVRKGSGDLRKSLQ